MRALAAVALLIAAAAAAQDMAGMDDGAMGHDMAEMPMTGLLGH